MTVTLTDLTSDKVVESHDTEHQWRGRHDTE